MDQSILEQLEKLKLVRESMVGPVQMDYVSDYALESLYPDIEEAMQKKGISIRFDYSYDANTSKSVKDPVTKDVDSLKKRLNVLEEKTSSLYVTLGNVDAYTDEPIVSLEQKRVELIKNLGRITTGSAYEKVEASLTNLEEEYRKVSEKYESILRDKLKENDLVRDSIDFSYLINLPNHEIEQVRSMGDSLLSLYQSDKAIQEVPETIADAIAESRKLNFYKESVDKIKREVEQKEKGAISSKIYEEYKKHLSDLLNELDTVLESDDLGPIVESFSSMCQEYSLKKVSLSLEHVQELNSLIQQVSKRAIEKRNLLVFGAYKKLEAYVNTHRLDLNKEESLYQGNSYDYYNLNKVAEEVSSFNAQREHNSNTNYKDNAYSYYNLNHIASEVSAYNEGRNIETETPTAQEESSIQKEPIRVDAYLQNPDAFFIDKASEVRENPYLHDVYKEKILSVIEAKRVEFGSLFTGSEAIYNRTDIEKVRETLKDANEQIQLESGKYIHLPQDHPLLNFEKFRMDVQRDRSLDENGKREMLQYIKQLEDQYSFSFSSSLSTLDSSNKEQTEQYMKAVEKMIQDKKDSMAVSSAIVHTR